MIVFILLILIPALIYFAITFYTKNKLYLDIWGAIVIDRGLDYYEDLMDEVLYRYLVLKNKIFK